MKVERLDHIHVVVKDLEKAAKFFSELLDTRFAGPKESKGLGDKIAFDRLGFELMQPTGPGTVADLLDKYGEGVTHIGLKVSNLDEAVAEFRARGINTECWRDYKDPAHKDTVNKGATTSSPEKTFGVNFEIVEYEDIHPTALATYRKAGDIPRM